MADRPHCGEPLERSVGSDELTVHRDGAEQTIEPDVFTCHSCDAVLFATVSRELDDA